MTNVVVQAWRNGQLQLAEHLFDKAFKFQPHLDPQSAESLADLLFEMGKQMLAQNEWELAVKWLERANDVLMGQELDKLSIDATELRTSILQSSVKALLGLQDEHSTQKATQLVEMLSSEIGDKLIVLLLKLEILSLPTNNTLDGDEYYCILRRMCCTIVLSDANFKLIMHHIRKLNDRCPSFACNILNEFLKTRIFQYGKDEWVEKALVTSLWMATKRDGDDVLASVESVLEVVASNVTKAISASTTHASQTVRT